LIFLFSRFFLLFVGLTYVLFSIGCSSESNDKNTLRVFAASSLTDVFQELKQQFEKENPRKEIFMIFAGSQVLRMQIERGANADVFASANENHVDLLLNSGHATQKFVFAKNELALIIPTGRKGIHSLEDLINARELVVGAKNVPIGVYTQELFRRVALNYGDEFIENVRSRIASYEINVRLVRAKIELGEADAGIVYSSDVRSEQKVQIISIPENVNVKASYPIAILSGSKKNELGQKWIDFLVSEKGQAILLKHRFLVD